MPGLNGEHLVLCAVLGANKYLKHYEMSIEKLALCHETKSWKKHYEVEARIVATVGMKYQKDTSEKYDMQYMI